jgi:glycosyltransferase involved in cell wall biosynthesis
MNILFVNYGQPDNNSAQHILGHAKALAARGHDVLAAMVKAAPLGETVHQDGFRLASLKTVLKVGPAFTNRRAADVLHVWTPREIVREFAGEYRARWGAASLIMHLEDPEEVIFQRCTGRSVEEARDADTEWPKGLIHPCRFADFMQSADGITIVHHAMMPLVPADVPAHELAPVIDADFFSPQTNTSALRTWLGLQPEQRVIAYNGNDHAVNALDTRSLYEAMDIVCERRPEVVFVRTGHVLDTNYEGIEIRPGPRCRELGFIERAQVPEVMRLAEVFVQPGMPDEFNRHRLPAKVPEYLCMGRPVVMGEASIGAELLSASAARILPQVSAATMAEAVIWLLDHPQEAETMGARGRQFALERFAEKNITPALESFYRKSSGP